MVGAIKRCRWALTLVMLSMATITRAETVDFESPPYYCAKLGGQSIGGNTCRLTADPDGAACSYLKAYDASLFRGGETAALYGDVSKNFCGHRTTSQLLSIAEHMRREAMSYVSMGRDESECDPLKRPTNNRCNETSYAAYFLYMCAAYKCKYAD